MAVAQLSRPGIEVLQVFRATSPTILNPTLAPLVLGVCRQVVDVVTSGVVNPDAVINLPAFFVAKEAAEDDDRKYLGLDGETFAFSVNYGDEVTVEFASSSAGLTPASVVSQVNKALKDAGVTEATAEVVGYAWRLRTIAPGDGMTITLGTVDTAVTTAFGLADNLEYSGTSNYQQYGFQIPTKNFPDPRSNLAYLVFQPDTVRVFLGLGTGVSMREAKRTESFLRGTTSPTGAIVTGSVDLVPAGGLYGGGGTLDATSFSFKVDGGTAIVVTFTAPANSAAVLTAINTAAGATIASLASGVEYLVLSSPTRGPTSSIEVIAGGTALTALGLTAGTTVGHAVIEALDDGNGDSRTPLVSFYDEAGTVDLTATTTVASAAVVTGTNIIDFASLDEKTLIISDGRAPKTVQFDAPADADAVASQIQAHFDATDGLTAVAAAGKLVLTSTVKREDGATVAKGYDSVIAILGGTAVNGATNYLDDGSDQAVTMGRHYGNPYAVVSGDELWSDGRLLGRILQVAPGGRKNVVKLDRQISTAYASTAGAYVLAKNLADGGGVLTRPKPDLIVDGLGNATLKHDLLRDIYGTVVETLVTASGVSTLIPTKSLVYVSYKAVRTDVTMKARRPGLLSITDTTMLSSLASPVNADNPMALGTYFALLNAPGSAVNAFGVDEVSADAPYGTVEAFTRAFEFLESVEVYAIAPMTNDETVGQVASAHATSMSLPENKGERVIVFNSSMPTAKVDTLLASGTSGNGTPDTTQFDTGIANLAAILLANDLDPSGELAVDEGVFLDIATDAKKYSISGVSGSVVTVRTLTGDFEPGENDDGFYAEDVLPSALIDELFAIRVRGASLTLTDGTPDKLGMATTLQAVGLGYANRRFWNVVPDKVKAVVEGLEQELPGFYMPAAIVGMVGQQPPQQSFTNFPMAGFTGVVGSNDFFTAKQLDIISAGGNWIVRQDGAGTPIFSHNALTTDMRSVETKTDSITKIVDFASKFLRTGLKTFVGRYNVTSGFLDSLSHVIQGLLAFLIDVGVLVGAQLNNLIQDADSPDTVLVDITLDVPFPCNYIKMVLNI
jgi:hypothetical protein